MIKRYFLFLLVLSRWENLSAQLFSNSSNLLPGVYHSGGVTGVADMNNDGRDDIIIMDESRKLRIAYQQANGTFTGSYFGSVSNKNQWGMCVGDIDNDGHFDVMCGGNYDGVHLVNINTPSDFSLSNLPNSSIYMQACNFADINNDGWLDAFACHDEGESIIFKNDGSGSLIDGNDLIDFTIYPESDNSGNYGSVWSDFDRDGDIDCMVAKCRQFVSNALDPRRTNVLLVNDGNNVYHDEAHERGLVNLQQSWTTDFADIDNDGDFDCIISTHSGTLELYENNGFGYFTNITTGSGLEISGFFLQVKAEDFDNDGWVDIIYAGGVEGFLHNNGDQTFSPMSDMFPYDEDVLHSFGIGDLNNDGWQDIYASYGSQYVDPDFMHPDQLFLNNGGSNNWISFDLQGTISNQSAVGAIVEIYGPWGIQVREVRAGESYGISNSFLLHFGIANAASIEYAVIHWPAGGIEVLESPAINTVHSINETPCTPPQVSVSTEGNLTICSGESISLNVDDFAGTFLWNNGETFPSISVSEAGQYMVYAFDNTGCAGSSNVLDVQIATIESAVIHINGETEFCEGMSAELTASNGLSYSWSNGADEQTIVVNESGIYSVTIHGLCNDATSDPVEIIVFDTPDTPQVNDIAIDPPSSVTFTYTGNDVRWYDSENADIPVATGNTFTTPVLSETTSFWVEDVMTHEGLSGSGGKLNKEDSPNGNYAATPGYYLLFDALEDITITSVKVYAANAGNRTIKVIGSGEEEIASGVFSLPSGESVVDLNFFIPQGNGYGLMCSNSNPQLWRDRNLDVDTPFDFPYNINDLATITSTSVVGNNADNYYYFFYDWKVETATYECPSPREEVQVVVTGVPEMEWQSAFSAFPNPANDVLNISFNDNTSRLFILSIIDQTGRMITTEKWNCYAG
ncbi:MAG: CRTAC1 family protein, partial [Crocinitomicaceae bacterium]|nr:CRTAC1 family protein [Crocinitomicaceae bacterium]